MNDWVKNFVAEMEAATKQELLRRELLVHYALMFAPPCGRRRRACRSCAGWSKSVNPVGSVGWFLTFRTAFLKRF